jgi:hypothetical protein
MIVVRTAYTQGSYAAKGHSVCVPDTAMPLDQILPISTRISNTTSTTPAIPDGP